MPTPSKPQEEATSGSYKDMEHSNVAKIKAKSESIMENKDFFLERHLGQSWAYNNATVPDMIQDFFVVADTNNDGTVTAEELDNAADIVRITRKAVENNKAELNYKHLPKCVKDVLSTWDSDKSGTVGLSELVAAAEAQKKLMNQNKIQKLALIGCAVLILILTSATFGLSFISLEMTKETKAGDDGVMRSAKDQRPVGTSSVQSTVALLDLYKLKFSQLNNIKTLVFDTEGGGKHSITVGDISREGSKVTIETPAGTKVIIGPNGGTFTSRGGDVKKITATAADGRRLKATQDHGVVIDMKMEDFDGGERPPETEGPFDEKIPEEFIDMGEAMIPTPAKVGEKWECPGKDWYPKPRDETGSCPCELTPTRMLTAPTETLRRLANNKWAFKTSKGAQKVLHTRRLEHMKEHMRGRRMRRLQQSSPKDDTADGTMPDGTMPEGMDPDMHMHGEMPEGMDAFEKEMTKYYPEGTEPEVAVIAEQLIYEYDIKRPEDALELAQKPEFQAELQAYDEETQKEMKSAMGAAYDKMISHPPPEPSDLMCCCGKPSKDDFAMMFEDMPEGMEMPETQLNMVLAIMKTKFPKIDPECDAKVREYNEYLKTVPMPTEMHQIKAMESAPEFPPPGYNEMLPPDCQVVGLALFCNDVLAMEGEKKNPKDFKPCMKLEEPEVQAALCEMADKTADPKCIKVMGKAEEKLDLEMKEFDGEPLTVMPVPEKPAGGKPEMPEKPEDKPAGGKPEMPEKPEDKPAGGKPEMPEKPADKPDKPAGGKPEMPEKPAVPLQCKPWCKPHKDKWDGPKGKCTFKACNGCRQCTKKNKPTKKEFRKEKLAEVLDGSAPKLKDVAKAPKKGTKPPKCSKDNCHLCGIERVCAKKGCFWNPSFPKGKKCMHMSESEMTYPGGTGGMEMGEMGEMGEMHGGKGPMGGERGEMPGMEMGEMGGKVQDKR